MQEKRQIEAKQQAPPMVEASLDRPSAHQVHGYDFIRLLGHGAQGETWLASDKNGKKFAIKVYDMRLMQGWKDETLLRREVAVLEQLDIKGVPKYEAFIEDLPKFYLVMEYISAPTLQMRMESGLRPKIEDAQKLLVSLAAILAELHSRLPPIIHRDIKPANIMVDDDYNAWIVDFGVVASQEQKSFASTVAGSVGYMAPELMMGRATPAVDIYSLGATMLHLISGKAPYTMDGDGINIDYQPHLPQSLPLELRELLDAMLAVFPKDRIASGQELLERIKAGRLMKSLPQASTHDEKLGAYDALAVYAAVFFVALAGIAAVFLIARIALPLIGLFAIAYVLLKKSK